MQDADAIIQSLLKRIEGLLQQSLATIEREQQKDKLIEEQAASHRRQFLIVQRNNMKLLAE